MVTLIEWILIVAGLGVGAFTVFMAYNIWHDNKMLRRSQDKKNRALDDAFAAYHSKTFASYEEHKLELNKLDKEVMRILEDDD